MYDCIVPDPGGGNGERQSSFAAKMAAHYDAVSLPHPTDGLMPPPVPRLGPVTHLGGVRMRKRDRLALRLRILLQKPKAEVRNAG